MEPILSQISRIQLWCERFLFWTRNTLFGKIWSQNSMLFQVKFGTETYLNMQNSLNALNVCRICIFAFFVFVWKYPFWLRKHRQKTFVTHSGFWLLKGWGWVNPIKMENFWGSFLFQLMLNEVLNNLKMISADVKANKNNKK